ncbi:hypothetical protein SI65_08791 [Aspergillus cristatus]|uniref:Mitochondrial division protein 1 n=1 Tax=Aspergillus cristatus TaxID=573508 RepID=A0A1E3B4Q7_ASPCR|nr:hypothetical protein SI65_08791 [Aspergillus cristatus]
MPFGHEDAELVLAFLKDHLLHWIEVLGLIGRITAAVNRILELEKAIPEQLERHKALHEFLYDSGRFLLYHRSIIEDTPLQVYHMATVFTPTESLMRTQFHDQNPKWLPSPPMMQGYWDQMEQEFHVGTTFIGAINPAHDGVTMACSTGDFVIWIWNVRTGQVEQRLESPTFVTTLAFSKDGNRLLSLTKFRLCAWNLVTGQPETALTEQKLDLSPFFFGSKVTMLLSEDSILVISNSATGTVERTLDNRSYGSELAFDGIRIAFWTDNMAYLCSMETRTAEHSLEFPVNVRSIKFSPTRLAIFLFDSSIQIRDLVSGQCINTLRPSDCTDSLAISSDGTKLVCAALCYAHVWDLTTGHLEGTLDNNPERIGCLSFVDHDRKLAVSHGTRVRIWDTGSLLNSEKSPRSKEVTHLGLSGKGSKVILSFADESVEVRDVITGRIELKKAGQGGKPIISPDGTRVASVGHDDCLRVWNAVNGDTEIAIECPLGDDNFAFSPDSTKLIVRPIRPLNRAVVEVWSLVARKQEQIIPWEPKGSVTISPDGTKASFKTPWNFSSPIEILCLKRGQIEHSLERTKNVIDALAISHKIT